MIHIIAVYGFSLIAVMFNEVRVHRATDNDGYPRIDLRSEPETPTADEYIPNVFGTEDSIVTV